MRRISSAPNFGGSTFQGNAPPTSPVVYLRSQNSNSTTIPAALPIDLMAIQSTTPISTIGQCILDQAINKSSDNELALCISTPTTAPDTTCDADTTTNPRLLERHIAYLERVLRQRRRARTGRSSSTT